MQRLGLAFDDLAQSNPQLIYVSISGYGASGPDRHLPGHDFQYLARVGGIPAPPAEAAAQYVPTTVPAADMGASLYASLGVLVALLQRLQNPGSFAACHLDVAIADCALAMMEPRIAEAIAMPSAAKALARPGYGIYLTSDDRYVSIGALEDHFWERLVQCLGLEHLRSRDCATFEQRRCYVEVL